MPSHIEISLITWDLVMQGPMHCRCTIWAYIVINGYIIYTCHDCIIFLHQFMKKLQLDDYVWTINVKKKISWYTITINVTTYWPTVSNLIFSGSCESQLNLFDYQDHFCLSCSKCIVTEPICQLAFTNPSSCPVYPLYEIALSTLHGKKSI